MNVLNALIVGKGRIGTALAFALQVRGWNTCFFASQKDNVPFFSVAARCADVVFIAISTRDDGAAARTYLLEALRAGRPVVTCEKGALANYFGDLEPYLPYIGFTATVGGGSELLSLVRRPLKRLVSIRGVVNGTLNFLFWCVAQGRDPYAALREAQERGLCEPGAKSLAEVVNAELRDALLKSAIVWNVAGLGLPLRDADFSYSVLAEPEILRLLRKKATTRFMLSIRRTKHRWFEFGGFMARRDGWVVCGDFVSCDEVPDDPLLNLSEEHNALIVKRRWGPVSFISGKGAGIAPTVRVMVRDAYRLLRLHT